MVLGRGKRLFSETAKPSALRLVRSQVSTTGVVMSTYVPGGDIQPGSFASAEPSEKELARRKKMANGYGDVKRTVRASHSFNIATSWRGLIQAIGGLKHHRPSSRLAGQQQLVWPTAFFKELSNE